MKQIPIFVFLEMDWEALICMRLPAPWVPPIKDPLDTSNFDPYGAFLCTTAWRRMMIIMNVTYNFCLCHWFLCMYFQDESDYHVEPYVDQGGTFVDSN